MDVIVERCAGLGRAPLPCRCFLRRRAWRGRPDVALANVLGTVVDFIAFNAGVIALVQPVGCINSVRRRSCVGELASRLRSG
ncbi:MAG: hypothetical protein ACRDY6_15265 [Acidimicrobiia bacterium]